MAISTNALALGASMPAKGSYPAESHADAGQGSAASGAAASGSSDSSTGTGGPDPSASPAPNPKTTGPSAQTRGNARAHSRGTAAASPGSQPATDPQDAAQDSSGDFGSIMASALGRSAAVKTAGTGTAAAAANTPDAATPATPGQPPGIPGDAVAWIAQALLPATAAAPAAGATAVTADAAAKTPAVIGLPTNPASAPAQAQTPAGPAVQFAAQNDAAAANATRSAANAMRAAANAAPAPQVQATPASDAQSAADSSAAPGTITALADVQKLISGLTGVNPAKTDPNTDSATPPAHAAAAGDSADAAQAAAAVQASALSRANSSLGTATLTIHAPVGSAAFADEVSARAADLAQSGLSQAQLQLNPTDLGPVQVHITMQAGQASVWFGAAHADTRAALEQSLPRLRELFAGAGMPLTDSGVFREPPQQQQAQSVTTTGSGSAPRGEPQAAPGATQVANIRLSLLDTYA